MVWKTWVKPIKISEKPRGQLAGKLEERNLEGQKDIILNGSGSKLVRNWNLVDGKKLRKETLKELWKGNLLGT